MPLWLSRAERYAANARSMEESRSFRLSGYRTRLGCEEMSNNEYFSLITPATPHGSGAGAVLNTATTATLSPVLGSGADVNQINFEGAFQGWEAGALYWWWAQGFITTTATSTTFT